MITFFLINLSSPVFLKKRIQFSVIIGPIVFIYFIQSYSYKFEGIFSLVLLMEYERQSVIIYFIVSVSLHQVHTVDLCCPLNDHVLIECVTVCLILNWLIIELPNHNLLYLLLKWLVMICILFIDLYFLNSRQLLCLIVCLPSSSNDSYGLQIKYYFQRIS